MKQRLIYWLPPLLLVGYSQSTYKTTSLAPKRRAELLLKKLTLEEKAASVTDNSQAVECLGIKPYNWWNEALHGVTCARLTAIFPQPIGMTASFSPESVYEVSDAVSDKARAKNVNYVLQRSYVCYQGFTMWTPMVNIYRDPRWGRGIEAYGEGPYFINRMGVMVVKGLQGTNDGKYDKLHTCAKHFAVYSGPEWNRHSFNVKDLSARDSHETYLPSFETLVKEAKVREVMCAYNNFEGEPCYGSNRSLMQILRNDWGFGGIILFGYGAIADFYNEHGHKTYPDAESASTAAVLNGTDLKCGSSYKALVKAVCASQINGKDIDKVVMRLLEAHFVLGEMDDPDNVSWTKIPFSAVASAEHGSLALDMTCKSMILLQNIGSILPLKCGELTVAVTGPNANDSVM